MSRSRKILWAVVLATFLASSTAASAADFRATGAVSAFTGNSVTLSTIQKTQVKKTVELLYAPQIVSCISQVKSGASVAARSLAQKRAVAVCNFAKSLDNSISTRPFTATSKTSATVGKVLLTVTQPNVSITLENLDAKLTHRKAWASVREALAQNSAVKPVITYYLSPLSKGALANAESPGIERAARLWGGELLPTNARIIYVRKGVSSERTWLVAKAKELGLEYMLTDAGAWYDTNCGALGSQSGGYLTIIQCLGSSGTMPKHIGPHEYTHWYQYAKGDLPSYAPNWFTEGSAVFYGMAIGFYGAGDQDKARTNFHKAFADGYNLMESKTGSEALMTVLRNLDIAGAVALMTEVESYSANSQKAYFLGELATEALVGAFGHSKYLEFANSFVSSKDWKKNFEQVYGLTPIAFYEKLTPFLRAMAQ